MLVFALCAALITTACISAARFSRLQAELTETRSRLSEAQSQAGAAAQENDALRRQLDGAKKDAAALREETARLSEAAKNAPAEETPEATPAADVRGGSLTLHTLVTARATKLNYLLYAPDGAAGEALPLLLFLHGSGGCGDDPEDLYSDDTLPTMLKYGWLRPGALVLIPQCPGDESWDPYCEDLMELLELVKAQYGADPDRVSVTGFSLGGIGCFTLLCRYPDYFSAAMPVSALCEEPSACRAITSTPVRILHGELDTTMDSRYVVLANDIINAAGGHSTLTFLPGEKHFIQQHYLDNGGEPVEWLISQRRGANK